MTKVKSTSSASSKVTQNQARYSDLELDNFKELCNFELQKAEKELESLKKEYKNSFSDRGIYSTSPSSNPADLIESYGDMSEKIKAEKAIANAEEKVKAIKNTKVRIENKTFGQCAFVGCKELISKDRLRSVIYATKCMCHSEGNDKKTALKAKSFVRV